MSSVTESDWNATWPEDTGQARGGTAPVSGATAVATVAAVTSPLPEAECIAYLLHEIPEWLERGWICDHCSGLLEEEYIHRRDLLEQAGAVSPSLRLSQTGTPASSPSIAEIPLDSRPPALAEFLESHSMKLFALVAALLIFVGMRQIVQWKSGGAVALSLVPLLPIGLTAILYSFGIRSRSERDLGGYAFCVVAIILAAFTVFSVNEHWLRGALSQPAALFAGIAVATGLTAATLRMSRDPAYLHLLLGGIAATANAGLQVHWTSSWLAPTPAWLYGAAQLGLAYMALAVALRLSENDGGKLVLTWMHLFVAIGIGRALLAVLGGDASLLELGVLMAGFAVLSAVYAQWLGGPLFVYCTGSVATAAAAMLLAGAGIFGWYPASTAAMLITGLAMVMCRINGGSVEAAPLRIAYQRLAWVMSGVAGAGLAARVLFWVAGRAELPASADWAMGVLAAVLCAGFYVWAAVDAKRAWPIYGASAAGAFAVAVTNDRLLAAFGFVVSERLAQDLLPFAALGLSAELWLRSRRAGAAPAGAESAVSFSCCAAIVSGLAAAIAQGTVIGPNAALWIALAGYGMLASGGALLARESRYLGIAWPVLVVADTVVTVAFLVAWSVPPQMWPHSLAAGLASIAAAWAWYWVAESLRSRPQLGESISIGAGLSAATGAGLATIGAVSAPGWMSLAYAGSLALLVTMGVRRSSQWPIVGSFMIVLLCPARLSGAALDQTGVGSPAVLAAVLFALAAAAIYGLATWRMRKPDLVWLAVGALAIAGGGGLLFGGPQTGLVRTIALVSGLGMAGGALGLGVTAGWGRKQLLTYASGAMLVVAYYRLITLFFAIDRPWLGMAMLPAIMLLVVTSHLRTASHGDVFHQPLQRVALAAAYIVLPLLGGSALQSGFAAYFPIAVTLFFYALVFGISAQAGATLDHPLGVLSTGALLAGWFFGLQVPRSHPHALLADVMLVAITAICAVLYGRVAWRQESQAPAYGATLAGVCAWVGLLSRVANFSQRLWSLSGLPLLIALYTIGSTVRGKRGDALSVPLLRSAWAISALAAGWVIYAGLSHWDAGIGRTVSFTLGTYGIAFALGAERERTSVWAAAVTIAFSLACAFGLATVVPSVAVGAACFAPIGLVWLAVARAVQSRLSADELARPFFLVSFAAAIAVALLALPAAGEAASRWPVLAAFGVAGYTQLGLFRAGRGKIHAHAAFLTLLPGYFVLLFHVVRLDNTFADLYLVPVGLYGVVLAQQLAGHGWMGSAWLIRWAAALLMLGSAFQAVHENLRPDGSPMHALLLLLECTAAIGCGIAGRVRTFVQAGMLFAMAFVAFAAFSSVEIWTGFISIVLGIGLLVCVFYLSIHRDAVRAWVNRSGSGQPRPR